VRRTDFESSSSRYHKTEKYGITRREQACSISSTFRARESLGDAACAVYKNA
jgi:hypothetical protein